MGENVIELNGKRYDAITGAYLGKSNVIPKHITDHYVHGKVIDGFVRPARPSSANHPAKPVPTAAHHKATEHKPDPKPAPEPTAIAGHAAHNRAHSPAAHVKHHRPERSKTLMRRATKKPEFTPKPHIKPQAPAEIMAKPMSAIAHKRSAYGIDPRRQQRAAIIGQHYAVKHFHSSESPVGARPVTPQIKVVPVRAAPQHLAARPAAHTTGPHSDIFEQAMARASSHEQPVHRVRHRRKHRRLVNTMAIAATFLIIGGFFTYLNLPQLQLRVASVQAGFGASMPGYVPTGYALEDGVQRSGGTITLSFRSGDSRFQIIQQSSDWNSQTLLDNTLALGGAHQAIEKNGQKIFIYNNSTSAAWVNGGVRYDLTGNAQLSTDEIISIATNL